MLLVLDPHIYHLECRLQVLALRIAAQRYAQRMERFERICSLGVAERERHRSVVCQQEGTFLLALSHELAIYGSVEELREPHLLAHKVVTGIANRATLQ